MTSSTLPSGAEALLIALETPAPQGHTGIPVLLWGPPGVGKSSFLEALAHTDFPVQTLIAAIHDPTDFSGLPIHHDGKVRYAPPEWLDGFGTDGKGILFLDELSTAPPAVQAALLRVVLERKVGFHDLPGGVRVVAAANPPGLSSGGWQLSPPLRNRFVHLQWELPLHTFLAGLEDGFPQAERPVIYPDQHARCLPDWKLRIAGFLRNHPDLLSTAPDQSPYAFASPRSWDFAASLLASCELLGQAPKPGRQASSACFSLLIGCLGEEVGIPLIEYLKQLQLPKPDDFLLGKSKVTTEDLSDNETYLFNGLLIQSLRRHLEQEEVAGMADRYFDFLQSLIQAGRQDLIYNGFKRICQDGLLTQLSHKAAADPGRQGFLGKIQSLFAEKDLQAFIKLLEE